MSRAGADWLVRDTSPDDVFTPERLSEEHRLVEQTAAEFVANEVAPALPELEKKNWALARTLVARAADLGLIGVDTPEEFGGVGMDKAASIIVNEAVGEVPSFATTFGGQSGLAIIPILCFGTEDQKKQYLPRIVSGEIVGAYCLSESGSGSDALSARARAVKQSDGSWMLTGEKMWTTNGGFADFYIVFAKVDGEQFSAFIVERGFPGVVPGKEEHKLGLHGSSTTALALQDAQVPAANLLGDIGKGHKIALNTLNYGRFKLAGMCTGGARAAIAEAAKYAGNRRQFGRPIAQFGAIRHKLAEMAIRLYAVESALFRLTGLIDQRINGSHEGSAMAAALEEFAVEASLLKIAASEMIDYVVDENVQIHGGNGFVADYPAERRYRDARANRIFEGTNEINRLVVPTTIIKRALKGDTALIPAAKAALAELTTADGDGAASSLRKIALAATGAAMQVHGDALQQEQEVLMALADLMLEAFVAESAGLRASQARSTSHSLADLHADAASVIAHDAALRVHVNARTLFASLQTGDDLKASLAGVQRILNTPPVDTIAARRRIADAVSSQRGYVFRGR